MGLGLPKVVYKDADAFPYAREIDPAVPGPSRWLLPGLSDIDLARRDFATGNLLSYTGTPVVDAHYTTGARAVGYFQSGIIEPTEFTVCLIGKRDDTAADNANIGVFFGSFAGAGSVGCMARWSNATTLQFVAYQTTDTQKATTLTPTSPTVLHRYTFIVTAAAVTLINETDATTDTEPVTAARQPGVLPINILASQSNTYLGDQGLYSFAMWPFALTSDQRTAHWAQMALHTARDGVSVG